MYEGDYVLHLPNNVDLEELYEQELVIRPLSMADTCPETTE